MKRTSFLHCFLKARNHFRREPANENKQFKLTLSAGGGGQFDTPPLWETASKPDVRLNMDQKHALISHTRYLILEHTNSRENIQFLSIFTGFPVKDSS